MLEKRTDCEEKFPLLSSRGLTTDSKCAYKSKPEIEKSASIHHRMVVVTIICSFFIVGEVLGGILANSLAILMDLAHMICDGFSFVIALVSIQLLKKSSTKTMTFGWYRAEVIGALFSVLLIWMVTVVLVYFAIVRIIYDTFHINGSLMFILSGLGLFVNLIMALVLYSYPSGDEDGVHQSISHGHSHGGMESSLFCKGLQALCPAKSRTIIENLNLRAAFIHVVGDIVQSVGVLIASCIVYLKPEWKIVDPICTFLFSGLVLYTTFSIFFDVICVLMERKPKSLCHDTFKDRILAISGVLEIHKLRLWNITLGRTAVTCHITIVDKGLSKEVLDKAYEIMSQDFHISEITIQIETQDPGA